MNPVEVMRGESPLVLGLPHAGTFLPDGVTAKLNERGQALADTDWHVDRLYDGLAPGASVVRATFHRYVTDANRDPSGASLYPGQNTTGLVPLTDFDGHPIWSEPPDEAAVAARREAFHAPYHAALGAALEAAQAQHGFAVLYDCHSIRSRIPYLFDGVLPDLNVGTDGGRSCDPSIEAAASGICADSGYRHVTNGRFRGGWTTRHYGRPAEGLHAVQMELAQSTYMDEAPPWTYRPDRADRLRPVLARILAALTQWRPA